MQILVFCEIQKKLKLHITRSYTIFDCTIMHKFLYLQCTKLEPGIIVLEANHACHQTIYFVGFALGITCPLSQEALIIPTC